jgi:CRISPR-associated protein Csb2
MRMTNRLCISVTFLDSLFHGKGDDGPEWPPAPMRLFQALLAGARTGSYGREWSSATARAFRWLESCGAPLIIAPQARRTTAPCVLFVPNNDADEIPDRQDRLTTKIAWPHCLLGGSTIHYVWLIPDSEADPEIRSHAELICRLARCLLALGWGIDQVVGNGRVLSQNEIDAFGGRRWYPWRIHREGSQGWRSPLQGTLDDLEAVHKSFRSRIVDKQFQPSAKPTSFESVHYLSSVTLPLRPFAAFELPDGIGFRVETTAKVAAMLRSLACDHAKADTHEFPGGSEVYVAGHVSSAAEGGLRFSYLPLPTIGHEHADGMIRRLLIAEPYGGNGAHARWAQDRLRNTALRDHQRNERGVLLDLWRPASLSMVERYVGERQTWSTVTPVVLPGFDDGKYGKAERLFVKAAGQAGVPIEAIETVALRKAPFWSGALHAQSYSVPNYLRNLSRWHVRIRFREPVPGPMALGPGRHVGLGLFAGADGIRLKAVVDL